MKHPLSCQLYLAYLAVFSTWVSCLTPNFGAQNYRKVSLQNSPRVKKKDEMRTSCNSVSNIHWRSKHVKYHYILNALDTTASHDVLRIREAYYGQSIRPINKFILSKSAVLHVHLIILSTFLCHHFTTTT